MIRLQITFLLKSKMNELFSLIDKKIKARKLIGFQEIKKAALAIKQMSDLSLNQKNDNKNIAFGTNKNDKDLITNNILQKINHIAHKIFRLYDRKIIMSELFYFIKWRENSKNLKYIEGLKTELDKRIKSKYDVKIEEFDNLMKKLNQESKAFKVKVETFEKNFLTHQKQINEFEIKEKEFLKHNKLLAEEKKKKVDNLNQAKNDLKANYAKIENYLKELEKTSQSEIENQNEKEMFLNNYINEMNSLLDFYEMKSSNFISSVSVDIKP